MNDQTAPATNCVIIPAYQPDDQLKDLLSALVQAKHNTTIIVIDDGSSIQHQIHFEQAQQLGAIVLTHSTNLGKGAALKTGMQYYLKH